MDFLHKVAEKENEDLLWNVPEQKQGCVAVIGGNQQLFVNAVRITEYLTRSFPVKEAKLVLPDALEGKVPPLENVVLLSSTESGSFSNAEELTAVMSACDYNLIIGDLSKNKITGKALAQAVTACARPVLVARDAVDLLAGESPERWLMNPEVTLMGSVAQLIKVFRAVYYPKMLLLSAPLVQIAENLHKFTLSYPVKIVTLVSEQVVVAANGQVNLVPLERTGLTPLMLWHGEMAAKIIALNLYNPGAFMRATSLALTK